MSFCSDSLKPVHDDRILSHDSQVTKDMVIQKDATGKLETAQAIDAADKFPVPRAENKARRISTQST